MGHYVTLEMKKVTYNHTLPRTVVLNQGLFVPQGTFCNVRKHFWLSKLISKLASSG